MYDKEFDYSIFKALNIFNPLENLNNFIKRAEILKKYQSDDNFLKIKENATRVSRILKETVSSDVKAELFVLPEEKGLFEAISAHNQNSDELEEYIISLNSLIKPTEAFFDKVLVMDKDEKIKNNRLSLLSRLKEKFNLVCDFEKL